MIDHTAMSVADSNVKSLSLFFSIFVLRVGLIFGSTEYTAFSQMLGDETSLNTARLSFI